MAGLATTLGSGAMTNSIADLETSQCVLIIGSNTSECHPLIGRRIMRARARGAKLIVIDPRPIQMAELADYPVTIRPGTDVALLNAMIQTILANGWYKPEVAESTEDFEAMKASVTTCTPEWAESITGVPAATIVELARVYAQSAPAAICYAMGVTQFATGVSRVTACCNLALLTGNIGVPGGGINPLRGQNNVQGACDMGGLPDVFSGYQKVQDAAARSRMETAWGTSLSAVPGMTSTKMIPAILEGKIKALYIMGENPLHSDPDLEHVRKAFGKLELLVVQDILDTVTAKAAHVVLPATAAPEKDGTFTSTERRCSRLNKAVDAPGEALDDWEILRRLANRMGQNWTYASSADVFAEMCSVTPSYAGMTYSRLGRNGLQWPCPSADHPGTPILHTHGVIRGKGRFVAVEYREPAEQPDETYPLVLSTGRMFAHYHTASMTGVSPHLAREGGEARMEISPVDAEVLRITTGTPVRLTTRRGSITAIARVTPGISVGTVFLPFHFSGSMVNELTQTTSDPIAGIAEVKHCAVRVEAL